MKKLNEEDIKNILAMRYVHHIKIKEIAEKYNVSPRRVQQILKNPTLQKPGRKSQKLSNEIIYKINRLYLKGYGIPTIRQILGQDGYKVSNYKIWRTLDELGILKKHSRGKQQFRLAEFLSSCVPTTQCYFIGAVYLSKTKTVPYRRIWFIVRGAPELRINIELIKKSNITLDYLIYNSPLLKIPQNSRVIIMRIPPLVPPKNSDNRLTRYLKKKNCSILWIPYPQDFRELFTEKTSVRIYYRLEYDDIFKKIEKYLNNIITGGKNEDSRSNKKFIKF